MVDLETMDGAKIVANAPTMEEDGGPDDVEGDCEGSHSLKLRGGHAPMEALLFDEIEQGERRQHFLPQLPPHSPSPPLIRPNIQITRGEAPMEIPNLLSIAPVSVPLLGVASERFSRILQDGASPTSLTPPFQTRTREPVSDEENERVLPRVRMPTLNTSASPTSSSEFPLQTAQSPTQMPLDNISETQVQELRSSERPSQIFSQAVTRDPNISDLQALSAHPPVHPSAPGLAQANESRPDISLAPQLGADIAHTPHSGFVSEFHAAVSYAQRLRIAWYIEQMEVLQGIAADAEYVFRGIEQMPLSLAPTWRERSAERHLDELMNQYKELAIRLSQALTGREQDMTNEERQQLMRNIWRIEGGLRSRRIARSAMIDRVDNLRALDMLIREARSFPLRVSDVRVVQDESSAEVLDDMNSDDDESEPQSGQIEQHQTGYASYST